MTKLIRHEQNPVHRALEREYFNVRKEREQNEQRLFEAHALVDRLVDLLAKGKREEGALIEQGLSVGFDPSADYQALLQDGRF